MTGEQREALLTLSPNWRLSLMIELCGETMHRKNSVRYIVAHDGSLAGEVDRGDIEAVTPLTPAAVASLWKAPRVLGSPWVIPTEPAPSQPVGNDVLNLWLQRAKKCSGVQVKGLGFHSEKRAKVRDPEFRRLSPAVQEELVGTNYDTLRRVYDEVTVEDMRREIDLVRSRSA